MSNLINKSDFIRYLECPAYFWFFKKNPSVLEDQSLSDFDKQLIKNGQEVEEWARKLFPEGVLVESREEAAVAETKQYLEDDKKVIFQASFKAEDLYAMVDILEWDETHQYWIINEVKGTTSREVKKDKHIKDATFQYILLNQAGYKVGKVNLIELNKEFVKDGDINTKKLLAVTDITEEVKTLEQEVKLMTEDMKRLLSKDDEPMPCDCIYKSRSNHCAAFKHLHPHVPEYSVHDIVRIGNSKARLEGLVEAACLAFDEIADDFDLTDLQRNHVNVEQTQVPIIDTVMIEKELAKVQYPIYFLDYETLPTAVPIYNGCSPYQQVPFQYSLHIQREPNSTLEHYEYIHTNPETHPMIDLAHSLAELMGNEGSVVVWNKKFEMKCNEQIAELVPELAEAFHGYNNRMFDLMEIFSKHHYLHPDFRGSYSIKFVLPVLAPELSYKSLSIQDGSMAMNGWKKMMFETNDQAEKDQLKSDLLEYCKLDTLAMVEIYKKLKQL